jgi:hypothetical protein
MRTRQEQFLAGAPDLAHPCTTSRGLSSFVIVDAQESCVSIVRDGERKIWLDPGSLGQVNLHAYACMIDSLGPTRRLAVRTGSKAMAIAR